VSQADTRSSIESLHARAEASYRSGDFEDARAAWNEILSRDPSDERAREGLQLLSLVDPKWAVFEEAEQEAGAGPAAGIEEVRALLRAGQLPEARQRFAALEASLPGDEAVAALSRELAAAEALRSDVDARLVAARQALASGDTATAVNMCRDVLASVPGDREAERLLEEAEAALAPPAAAPVVAGTSAPDLPLDLELDLDAVAPGPPPGNGPAQQEALPVSAAAETLPPVPGATAGGHLELDVPDDLPSIPLGGPSSAEPGPARASAAGETPASSEGVLPPEAEDALEDLFEAARELEEQVPVEELAAPGSVLPAEPPAAEDGEAALLVARAREELERGNTAEATQLAARALALDATLAAAEEILEEARRRDEEKGRQAEDLVGQAIRALDGGQPQLAIPLLRQVLELIPGHAEARELLARAEAAESVLPPAPAGESPVEADPAPAPAPSRPETLDLPPLDEAAPSPGPGETTAPPPSGESPAKHRSARKGGRRTRFEPPGRGVLVAVLALLLAGGGGVAAWRFGLLPFGPGDAEAAAAPAPVKRHPRKKPKATKETPTNRAPGEQAAEGASGAGAAAQGASAPAPRYTKRDVPRLVRQAERALRQGEEARAVELLEAARKADPLDFDLVEKLESARMRLKERRDAEARLAAAKQAFRDGDWPEALRIFYRIPGPWRPPQIDRWIADGWYNLGIQALKAGDVVEARRYFGDCLELAPDDEMARRHREVAVRYRGEPLDDAYWMYVRALEPRPLRE